MLSIVTTLSGILCKYDFDDIIVVVGIKQNKKNEMCYDCQWEKYWTPNDEDCCVAYINGQYPYPIANYKKQINTKYSIKKH